MRPRYEREIEEILRRMDDGAPPTPARVAAPVPIASRRLRSRRGVRLSLNPSTLFVSGLALAALSAPVGWAYPLAIPFVGIASVLLLVSAVAASVARIGVQPPRPKWRGQAMGADEPREIRLDPGGLARHLRRLRFRGFRDPRLN